jgi:uncharacterized membrane protein
MTDLDRRINQLSDKLENLYQNQDNFFQAIYELRAEIKQLKEEAVKQAKTGEIAETITFDNIPVFTEQEPLQNKEIEEVFEENTPITIEKEAVSEPKQEIIKTSIVEVETFPSEQKQPKTKSNLEKFIGENLISKIGIVILVIGVAIGAKYAIEKQWITPLMRIVFGYIVGGGLLGLALKLREKYTNFSAVLLSGAAAIMYFITYFAYVFYSLIPQIPTFGLMVVFTVFTVWAAISYNRQVIAHIGLVGAYAVPFLLSDGSGRVAVLLSYMAIINVGILVLAIKKYWKPLYYVSFGLTWLIYFSWYMSKYEHSQHFGLALTFLILFFILFYLAFLGYKFIKNEQFSIENIILLLANSFIFYGLGYEILKQLPSETNFLGLFTFCNAVLHFLVSMLIYKRKLVDKALFYLTFGLMLVFVTITIPVQFHGNWITLLWTGEALLLFWIGRKKQVLIYEYLSYPLILLSLISLLIDWYNAYYYSVKLIPIFNITCLTSVFFIVAIGCVTILNHKITSLVSDKLKDFYDVINYLLPAILIITTYFTFYFEINHFYDLRINNISSGYSQIMAFRNIWLLNYSLAFVSVLSFINLKKIKNQVLGYVCIVLSITTLFVFLTQGFDQFSELREYYLNPDVTSSTLNIGIRYISLAFLALTMFTTYLYTKASFISKEFKYIIPAVLIITTYITFFLEIGNYYSLVNGDNHFRTIWLLNYSLFFVAALSFANLKKIKNQTVGYICIGLNIFVIFVFLFTGLYKFSILREYFVNPSIYSSTALHIGIRYISFAFFALTLFSTYLYTKSSLISQKFRIYFDILLHLSILWIVSSEFLHWLEIARSTEGYKLLSIVWGIYALLLIALGIWKKKKHLRISAMALFGVTLLKLFFYDIRHLETITKTLVFVSLGIILLVISFLYNKYKHLISDEDTK